MALARIDEVRSPEQIIAIVVAGEHSRGKRRQVEGVVIGRFELHVEQSAVAFAGLGEKRGAHFMRVLHSYEVRVALRNWGRQVRCGIRACDRVVAQHFDAVAAQMPLLGEQLHHDAEIARIILERAEGADLWVGLRGQIRVHGSGRGLERERLGKIERLARDNVHRARDTAFDE